MPASGYFLPNDQSIVHVPAQGKVDSVVEFKEPDVELRAGEEYRVRASGGWTGVWIRESSRSEEKLMVNDEELNIGDFESNEILIRIPGGEGTELK